MGSGTETGHSTRYTGTGELIESFTPTTRESLGLPAKPIISTATRRNLGMAGGVVAVAAVVVLANTYLPRLVKKIEPAIDPNGTSGARPNTHPLQDGQYRILNVDGRVSVIGGSTIYRLPTASNGVTASVITHDLAGRIWVGGSATSADGKTTEPMIWIGTPQDNGAFLFVQHNARFGEKTPHMRVVGLTAPTEIEMMQTERPSIRITTENIHTREKTIQPLSSF